MKRLVSVGACASVLSLVLSAAVFADDEKEKPVYPVALLPLEERGAAAKDMAAKIGDLLFAKLAAKEEFYLVDRADMKKILDEQSLNISGAVKPGEANRVGQLTGAKILIMGSVVAVDKSLHLIGKIVGTETGRVVAASVEGKLTDELSPLVTQLADKIAETVSAQSAKLVPPPATRQDRLAAVTEKLGKARRPRVMIEIKERHVSQTTFDPAAQTEMAVFCKTCGFEVLDPDEAGKGQADVLITGEGLSEFGARIGANLVSVKARLEVKAIDRISGKVLAVDRETVIQIDLTEQIAGKTALQEAAAQIAERMLPKLVSK